ncbi:Asp-tRNA(Asn)/Glu-tRNA(Gln) amidotransferase subunit GatC [Candidatus Nomurabacteria bacterium]|nr:Asp-tRNA(Asn)/Glu-tRNA(Gln) amidotransferase subunit GatC [Candidatus Nomurabacteria bacterium]
MQAEEIKKIANLAKLDLSSAEKDSFLRQLSDILAYLDQIKDLNLEQVPESISGAEEIEHVLRTDQVEDSDPKSIRQAYQLTDDYLVSPGVFNKK